MQTTVVTRGLRVAIGTTAPVRIAFWSDRPTAAWTVTPTVHASAAATAATLVSFSPASLTGNNGDTATLQVTLHAVDPAYGGVVFSLHAVQGAFEYDWPVFAAP
jgi:hypothetical protein